MPLWWKIIYSDLFWDHDQLLSCHWALRRTFTFEGKGLTYSPLVYVFSVLHTDPHTSVLLDCVRVLVPDQLLTSQLFENLYLATISKHNGYQYSEPSSIFLISGMMAPHALPYFLESSHCKMSADEFKKWKHFLNSNQRKMSN